MVKVEFTKEQIQAVFLSLRTSVGFLEFASHVVPVSARLNGYPDKTIRVMYDSFNQLKREVLQELLKTFSEEELVWPLIDRKALHQALEHCEVIKGAEASSKSRASSFKDCEKDPAPAAPPKTEPHSQK